MSTQILQKIPTIKDVNAEFAKRNHLEFISQCWLSSSPFLVGLHTRAISARLDRALIDFKNGKSTYLIIMVPPRHGKTDMVSRYLPPRFLGLFPDCEVMVSTHNSKLANKISRSCRKIIKSKKYKDIFPGIQLARDNASVECWGIENKNGLFQCGGLLSGITGSGYHYGVLDDYCRGRKSAESDTIRQTTWEAFSDDFFTRRAPVSITIIMATPWHIDDVIGRLIKKMKEDTNFPQFEVMRFPAKNASYKTGYLFPERFCAEYYEAAFYVMGRYSASALMQCNPAPRGGNLLKTDKIQYIERAEDFPSGLRWFRAWDLASSKKERTGDDPDYTAGPLMAVTFRKTAYRGLNIPTIYIKDMIRGRWEAPERDLVIRNAAGKDGDSVGFAIEAVGPYKDAYTSFRAILKGIRTVRKITTTTDKVVRASKLEPIFEAGNVYILRAPWNDDLIAELSSFPTGAHDDQVDAIVTGYEASTKTETQGVFDA